jgi:serine/threonine protein kinase
MFVVSVFDAGVHAGRVRLAMENVRGRTLRQALTDVGDARDRSALLGHWLGIGHALAALHAAGLIHRAVKPENAVVGEDGRVRLIDSSPAFGHGSPAITAGYAAPEQRAGRILDARADQYAYCACVWEALTSARPRRDEANTLVLPRAAMLSPRLVRVLRRGLAEQPEDRFPSMSDLLAALERATYRRA